MNIDHLREYVYLANSLSFSATAKNFYVSPSVLSKHVASMESELATKLFNRDSHSVVLTKSGEVFLEDVKSIVNMYDGALERLAGMDQEHTTVVRVGYLRGAARPFLAMFVKRMRRYHPEIRLVLTCMEYGELFCALMTHRIDLALGMQMECPMQEGFEFQCVYPDRIDVVMALDHPLLELADGGISTDQLKPCDLMIPDKEAYPGFHEFVRDKIIPAGFYGNATCYRDVESLYLAVELNGALAFSSEHNIPLFGENSRFVHINDVDTSYDVGAIWSTSIDARFVEPCLGILEECRKRLEKRAADAEGASLFVASASQTRR